MKRSIVFFALLIFSFQTFSQDTTRHDPLMGPFGDYPVFANSVEILSLTDSIFTGGQRISEYIIDLDESGQPVMGNKYAPDLLHNNLYSECLAGDFNGDGIDELITAWTGADGMARFSLLKAVRQKPSYQWQWQVIKTKETFLYPNDPIRLVTADLDSTMRQEFIICIPSSNVLFMYAYKFNPVSESFELIDDFAEGYNPPYDIAAGDFSGDGFDDVIFTYHGIGDGKEYMTIGWYRFNPVSKVFQWRSTSGVPVTQWSIWKRLKATTGDFRNLGRDEAVVSLNVTSGSNAVQVYNYLTFNDYFISWWTPPGQYPAGWSWGYGHESDAIAADLNPDKKDGDELIVAGPGEVAVLKFNASLAPYYLAKTPFLNSALMETFERRHFLAVEDMDADTTDKKWMKEIIVAEHKQDSTTVFRVLAPVLDNSNNITGLQGKTVYNSHVKSRRSEMRVGDFDGDAIRLGRPTLVTIDAVCQPVVELKVPPTHFDYLNNTVYDVCQVFGSSTSEFKVTYTETNSTSSYFSTELTQGWGVSTELSGGFSAFGFKVDAYVKASYDQGYYGSHSENTTVTATQVTSSYGDDWILGTVTDYHLWEYPLFAMGKRFANILVQVPHFKKTVWFPRKDVIARNWVDEHEVGNLLSYRRSADIPLWAGTRLLTNFTGKYISTASSGAWELNLSNQSIDESKLTSNIGVEVGASVSRWGVEAKVAGKYSREEVNTHRSTATKDVVITVDVSDTDPKFGDANYLITPYMYWGQNGAMVIDYAVDLSSSGDPYGTFWDRNYLANPDPGFILPWRLDSYKGIGETENLMYYNKGMRVSPMYPFIGDTVRVMTNVHNFSLKNMSSPVTVRFYFGNPSSGGTPVTSLNGITDFSTGTISPQNFKTISMDFVVPSGLNSSSTLYAVIDPDNTTAEIHEDNNLGFVPLRVQGATGIEDEPGYIPVHYSLAQNYPNPFNPSTKIKYELPAGGNVTLKIFDILGNEMAVLFNGYESARVHEINWYASSLPSGVYFYQLRAGEYVNTKKMLLLK